MGRNVALENVAYALDCTMEVATRRNNEQAIAVCAEMRRELLALAPPAERADAALRMVARTLRRLISNLLSAIKFEMREVLIPFTEVTVPTHAFGLEMFPDYFQWAADARIHVPEDLVTILEADTTKLIVALNHLDKGLQQWSSSAEQ